MSSDYKSLFFTVAPESNYLSPLPMEYERHYPGGQGAITC